MITKKFDSQSSAIASYNYTDLAENTGMKLFYGCLQQDTDSSDYILTQNQIWSSFQELSGTTTSSSFIQVVDTDFDLSSFNAPQSIRGTAIVNICVHYGGAGAYEAYTTLRLRKWNGTTETEIANNTSPTSSGTTGGPTILCLLIPVTTITPFKKGETLRLTVEGWVRQTGTGTTGAIYGVDPMNRDGPNIIPSTDVPTSTTQLKAWIPFNLDL